MPCTEAYREHIMYTFNGYCKTVIRFAAINAWRDRSRRRQKEIPYEEYPITICGQTVILTNGDLAAALLSLPEKNREIIVLYFFGHYTQQEIGEMYGRCRSTTGYQIRRTLQLLHKRARYNSSMMDANLLKKGGDFDKLPETWVIFRTENDVMEKRLPLYPIERCFLGTGERFGDGSHILYVNGAYRGDTPIGKLMHDFSCTDAADMYYGTLEDRVRFFKESKEGIEIMCRAMEDMRNQTLKEGMINVAKKMLEDGTITLEKIAEFVGLSVDEVRKLKTDQNM